MRIFATSDLHADFGENRLFLEQLSDFEFREDALLVAGDIGHRFGLIEATLKLLQAKFGQVFYVPGNHELWVRGDQGDSLDKFYRIIELCDDLGVQTRPGKVDGHWIVPLFSWYSAEFDVDNTGDVTELAGWGDFQYCEWPGRVEPVDRFFIRMNQPYIRAYQEQVISFSHFVPRPDLLPPVEHLRFKGLPRVAGSTSIEDQVRALNARVHVFGHSHIRCDCTIDEVRYVQHGLGYPRERRKSGLEFKNVGGCG